MIKLTEISLLDMLPPNLLRDKAVAAAAKAIDSELQSISRSIYDLAYFLRLDTLTSDETDELAWQFHVDFYDPKLPLETRRTLVKNSFAWHRRKGTPSAVEELITTIFGDGEVEEWYEFGGQPGTFRVITSNSDVTDEQADQFLVALDSIKNTRSHLDAIQVSIADELALYWGQTIHAGSILTLKQVT